MDDALTEKIKISYSKLLHSLEEITKHYRQLLESLRKEKELLILAEVDQLKENNETKANLLYKIKSLDMTRDRHAKELATLVGSDSNNPRLLEIAIHLEFQNAERLRSLHAALEVLIGRIIELNKENEQYTKSALRTVNGAMIGVKEAVGGPISYEKTGSKSFGPEKAGNFVSREA